MGHVEVVILESEEFLATRTRHDLPYDPAWDGASVFAILTEYPVVHGCLREILPLTGWEGVERAVIGYLHDDWKGPFDTVAFTYPPDKTKHFPRLSALVKRKC